MLAAGSSSSFTTLLAVSLLSPSISRAPSLFPSSLAFLILFSRLPLGPSPSALPRALGPPPLLTCPRHMPPLALTPQGGTDLEKHRDLLMVENEQLRQEMRRCEAELQELRAKPAAPCAGCEHSQVGAGPRGLHPSQRRRPACLSICLLHSRPGLVSFSQESAQLRDKLSQLQLEVAENKGMLSELNLEVQQKTNRLAEVELRLKDCLAEKAQEEERLSRRLRDSHETIASLRAQSPPIKVSVGAGSLVQARTGPQHSAPGARGRAGTEA